MFEEIRKIRIILKAYQVPLLNEACEVVMQTLREAEELQRSQTEPDLYIPRNGHSLQKELSLQEDLTPSTLMSRPKIAVIKGPVPLPIKKRIYCVLRSPHVNKDSREHFEIRTHKKVIDIHDPGKVIITALRSINFSGGLCLEMKLFY